MRVYLHFECEEFHQFGRSDRLGGNSEHGEGAVDFATGDDGFLLPENNLLIAEHLHAINDEDVEEEAGEEEGDDAHGEALHFCVLPDPEGGGGCEQVELPEESSDELH